MQRKTAAWIIIVVVFVALVVASVAGSDLGDTATGPQASGATGWERTVVSGGRGADADIAIVPIVGTIVDGDGVSVDGQVGGDTVVSLLEALPGQGIDGVILEIDTPGGAVLASDDIAAAVERLSDEEDVPVVAWMRSSATSGGYYVSAPADRIVAHPSTITGSIGVILSYPNVRELSDDLGVEWVVVKSGEFKDMASIFRDLTAAERRILQDLIDAAYGDFVSVVSEGRDMDEATVRRLADGRIYTGAQAKEHGLVDDLGSEDAAYDAMRKLLDEDDLRIYEYSQAVDWTDIFLGVSHDIGLETPAQLLDELKPAAAPKLEYRAAL